MDVSQMPECNATVGWTASSFGSSSNITEYYPNGVIKSGYETSYNKTSLSWESKGTTYLAGLTGTYYVAPTQTDTIAQIQAKYTTLATNLSKEYCWYKVRYQAVLGFLMAEIQSPSASTTTRNNMLTCAIEMNARLNALTELVGVIANQEAARTNTYNGLINQLNATISQASPTLQVQQQYLASSDSILTTRKEMLRYTTEKNNHITNQISLWAALNVLAIGVIFTVYRNM